MYADPKTREILRRARKTKTDRFTLLMARAVAPTVGDVRAQERYARQSERRARAHAKADKEAAQIAAGTHRWARDGPGVWRIPKTQRPQCGARTRSGTACKAAVIVRADGSHAARCRNHGGLSTGPRSQAGRDAIAQSNRQRAARKRDAQRATAERATD